MGNLLWQHCYGGTNPETSWGITSVSAGYIVSGETFSINGDVTNNYGGKDGWIIGIDFSGNLLWEKNYGGSGEDWLRMMKPAVTGNIYSIGTSTSSDHDAVNAHGDYDFFILKFLPPCMPVTAGFTIQQNGSAFTFTDNSPNATNWFWDFGDGNTSTDQNPVHEYLLNGSYTICLVASDSCSTDTICHSIKVFITSTNTFSEGDIQLTIFPNPFSANATILFSTETNLNLKIDLLDLLGRKIRTVAEGNFVAGNHQFLLQKENLQAGIYYLQFITLSGLQTLKVILK